MGRRPEHISATAGLMVVTAIWGLTFPAIKTAMDAGASPLAFVAVRFLVAALTLWPFLGRQRAQPESGSETRALAGPAVVLGLLLGAGYVFQTIGLQTTTSANSGFITGTSVVMVPFLDRMVRGTRLLPSAVFGAFLALGGLSLIAEIGNPFQWSGQPGDLWTLGCAFSYALYLVVLQRYLGRFSHRRFLMAQMIVVAVSAGLLAPIFETVRLPLEIPVLLPLFFCAIVATTLVGLLQFRFQAASSPTYAALVFSLEPVFALLFSIAILSERPSPYAMSGGMLIVVGIVTAELGPRLTRRRHAAGQSKT